MLFYSYIIYFSRKICVISVLLVNTSNKGFVLNVSRGIMAWTKWHTQSSGAVCSNWNNHSSLSGYKISSRLTLLNMSRQCSWTWHFGQDVFLFRRMVYICVNCIHAWSSYSTFSGCCVYVLCVWCSQRSEREKERESVFKMDAIHLHWQQCEGGNLILSLSRL